MSNNPWTPKFAAAEEPGDWRKRGVCVTVSPTLFASSKAAEQDKAKKLCDTCTVLVKCQANALANGTRFGVEGGMTAEERGRHPMFQLAEPVSEFVRQTGEDAAKRFEKEQQVISRHAAAARSRRAKADDPAVLSELPGMSLVRPTKMPKKR